MAKFELLYTPTFKRNYDRLAKRDQQLRERVRRALTKLASEPLHPGLHSHVVDADPDLGNIWSSRVTGDIRILWAYTKHQRLAIVLIKIGRHDEVY